MKQWRIVVTMACIVGILAGCGEKKAEPAKVDGMTKYTDSQTGFSLDYPKNWVTRSDNGKDFIATSQADVEQQFLEYKVEGPATAKVHVRTQKLEGTMEEYIKEDRMLPDEYYNKPEQVTLGGVPATRIAINFDNGRFKSEKYYALKDSMITTLEFAAFGNTFDALHPMFEGIQKGFIVATPPAAKPVTPVVDTTTPKGPEPPSQTFMAAPGMGFSIQIPDNFRAKGVKAAGALGGTEYLGSRLDCTIRVDVLDASKQQNLDKIANDNKAGFGGSSPSSTTLGGAKAVVFNYSPAAGISRRVYLCVRDAKLYRVFVTWNNTEQATYLPVFEKSMSSFQFK